MRAFFLLIAAAIGILAQAPPAIEPGVSQSLAEWRAARYSDVRYKLNLTLEKMSPVLKGTMEIRVNISELPRGTSFGVGLISGNPTVGSRTPIILDWRKIVGHEKNSTISNVSINGTALSVSPSLTVRPAELGADDAQARALARAIQGPQYEEANEHLIFSEGVVAGENVIKLDFTSPILSSGSAITRYLDKEDGAEYIYSLFVPSDASTAFPVFDQPDLKARFSVTSDIPSNWTFVTNSEKIRSSLTPFIRGRDIDSFTETDPISTYVFAFAAGPFSVAGARDSKEVTDELIKEGKFFKIDGEQAVSEDDLYRRTAPHIYVRKSQAAKFKPHAKEIFRLTREAVRYLETYFDYKFPFPKYDLVLIPEFPFGGMEHAGVTFLREAPVIFPSEPTKGDYITRANLIFHETAHQWFGDTVTMKWFDDLWLKEGFAEFMAYKTLEKVMPEANAWKVFYERNKQAAYATDSTRGTTPIYQKIDNLSNAKSAYGNIVYRKAPSFLKQAEFYLGEDKFQTAVRAFLKKHEYANADWEDLVKEFEAAANRDLRVWAETWVKKRGGPVVRSRIEHPTNTLEQIRLEQYSSPAPGWQFKTKVFSLADNGETHVSVVESKEAGTAYLPDPRAVNFLFVFPNYQDYGYGIFLLDDKSREYVLKNIQNEKDPFLRSMMWGSLWDSVREAELDPREYVELVIRALSSDMRWQNPEMPAKLRPQPPETDETIIASILARAGTAMNYYVSEPAAFVETAGRGNPVPPRSTSLRGQIEDILLDRLQHASTAGQRITFYRAFVNNASTAKGREVLKEMLRQGTSGFTLQTADKFDIVTRLIVLEDPEAAKLLAKLEKSETGDDAKRYAYAAKAAFATAENKAKFWDDFVSNGNRAESWIEEAVDPFNSVRHASLTRPFLERALAELPNLKRTRKIFFINNWLGAWIGGQRDEESLAIVNKFLADNPKLDNDLRLKVLENVDLIERAVRIRSKYGR